MRLKLSEVQDRPLETAISRAYESQSAGWSCRVPAISHKTPAAPGARGFARRVVARVLLSCLLAARPRPATNREQRRAALGAVALPTGPTVGQGYLVCVGDRDLLAADASTLGGGILCC